MTKIKKLKLILIELFKKIEQSPQRHQDLLVLLFHEIQAGELQHPFDETYTVNELTFQAQISYLLQQSVQWLRASEIPDYFSQQVTYPNAVCLTFDDGSASSYQPLLEIVAQGAKATQFVIPHHVGQTGFMSWSQIKTLGQQGIEIGSHTLSHCALTTVAAKQAIAELQDSKSQIEDKLGYAVSALAYPYGKFNRRIENYAQQAGYKIAFSTQRMYANPTLLPYKIPRFEPATVANLTDLFTGVSHHYYDYCTHLYTVLNRFH